MHKLDREWGIQQGGVVTFNKKTYWARLALGLLLFGICFGVEVVRASLYKPNEFIVKLKPMVPKVSSSALTELFKADSVELVSPQSEVYLVKKKVAKGFRSVMWDLQSHPSVDYVEPNFLYSVEGRPQQRLPNDPELHNLWGLINTGQVSPGDSPEYKGVPGIDINAARAWALETGNQNIVVAVLDTGIDISHRDLKSNLWANQAELNGVKEIDDDKNGYVDDIYGYNFITNTGELKDDHGHGSHVAGTIAANGDDGIGIVGVAWRAQIMGLKFAGRGGTGTLADAIRAIDYATAMGAHILNNSWSGTEFSQALYESVLRSHSAGALFVASAGNRNSSNDKKPAYPASYSIGNIISVAAITNTGRLTSFSSFGASSVHIAAPGENIMSSTPWGYSSWSGTSMATPHVSGVGVLLMSKEPELSAIEVKKRLLETARPLKSLRKRVVTEGIVDAYAALRNE